METFNLSMVNEAQRIHAGQPYESMLAQPLERPFYHGIFGELRQRARMLGMGRIPTLAPFFETFGIGGFDPRTILGRIPKGAGKGAISRQAQSIVDQISAEAMKGEAFYQKGLAQWGLKGQLGMEIPTGALRQLFEEYPVTFKQKSIEVGVSPVHGIQMAGVDIPIKIGPWVFRKPRAALVPGLGWQQLPSSLFGQMIKGVWRPAPELARVPAEAWMSEIEITGGIKSRQARVLPFAESVHRAISGAKTGREVRRGIRELEERQLVTEMGGYAAHFRSKLGVAHFVTPAGDRVSLKEILAKAEREAHRKAGEVGAEKFGGYSVVTAVHERMRSMSALTAELPIGLSALVAKPEAFLKQGVVSMLPLAAMAPMGIYSDIRDTFQQFRRGHLSPSLRHAKSLLASGRRFRAGVQTAETMAAEAAHFASSGAPSAVMANIFMILEQPGTGPASKAALDLAEGELFMGRKLASMLTMDQSANAAWEAAKHRGQFGGLGSLRYEPAWNKVGGTNVSLGRAKGTVMGIPPERYMGGGAIDVLTSSMNIGKKFPDMERNIILENIIDKIGPRPSRITKKGREIYKAKTNVMDEVARAVGDATAVWSREVPGFGGAKYPYLLMGKGARLSAPNLRGIETALDRYSKITEKYNLKKVSAQIDTGYENIPHLVTGEITRTKGLKFVYPVSIRETSHTIQALLGIQGPSATGMSVTSKGVKLAELLMTNIGGWGFKSSKDLVKFLKEQRGEAFHTSEEMIGFMSDVTTFTRSMAGRGETTRGRALSQTVLDKGFVETADEIIVTDISKFRMAEKYKKAMDVVEKGLPDKFKTPGDVEAFDELYKVFGKKRMVLRTGPFNVPMPGGEVAPVSDFIMPRLDLYKRFISYASKTEEARVPRSMSEYIKALQHILRSGDTDLAKDQSIKAYQEFSREIVGKEGYLRKYLESRLAGSGYFGVVHGSKAAKIMGGVGVENFATVKINPRDLRRLGGLTELVGEKQLAQKAGRTAREFYGLLTSYPQQAIGNIMGVRVLTDPKVAEGAVAYTRATAKALRRDSDFDNVALVLNPFKDREKATEFQRLTAAFHRGQAEVYRAVGLEKFAGISKEMLEERGTLENIRRDLAEEATNWAIVEKEIRTATPGMGYNKTLAEIEKTFPGSAAKVTEYFDKALNVSPGELARTVREHPGGFMTELAMRRAIATQVATPHVVNAIESMRDYISMAHDVPTVKEALALYANKGVRARTAANTSIFLGNMIDKALKKSVDVDMQFLQLGEDFASAIYHKKDTVPAQRQIMDYISGAMVRDPDVGFAYLVGEGETIGKEVARVSDFVTETLTTMQSEGKMWNVRNLANIMSESAKNRGPEEQVKMLEKYFADASEMIAGTMKGTQRDMAEVNRLIQAGLTSEVAGAHIDTLAALNAASEVATAQEEIAKMLGEAKRGAEPQPFWEQIKGATGALPRRFWDWFRKPNPNESFYYAKRSGLVIGAALIGGAALKSVFFPNIVPTDNERQSSHVDMASPYMSGAMNYPRDLGYSVTTGGEMPSASPQFGAPVGRAVHPVIMGPGISRAADMATATHGDGMGGSPLPPLSVGDKVVSDTWSRGAGPVSTLEEVNPYGLQEPIQHLSDIAAFAGPPEPQRINDFRVDYGTARRYSSPYERGVA